jgi:TMEM175 potassium channel family protein
MEEFRNVNARLEAFCDAVFAISLTLLIIDIKIPNAGHITNKHELFQAIGHLLPSILAFLLSFITIFITWVNHHEAMRLVNKTSAYFIYANGFLLLTVVFIPFPTSLLGEFVLTQSAAPAVALYSSVFGLQAISWSLLCKAVLNRENPLWKSEKAMHFARQNLKRSYFALTLYTLCTVLAFWFPLTIAIFVALTWIVWLINGVNLKDYKPD